MASCKADAFGQVKRMKWVFIYKFVCHDLTTTLLMFIMCLRPGLVYNSKYSCSVCIVSVTIQHSKPSHCRFGSGRDCIVAILSRLR